MNNPENAAMDLGTDIRVIASRLKSRANDLANSKLTVEQVAEVALPELKQMALNILAQTILWEDILKDEIG